MDGNTNAQRRRVAEQEGMAHVRDREAKDAKFRREAGCATGGVLQAADALLAAVERMEAEADGLVIGTRVRDEREDRLGTVESRCRDFPLWPIGVRWDDGSFEPCGATELRVVGAVVAHG
jgi:hypothetical protein